MPFVIKYWKRQGKPSLGLTSIGGVFGIAVGSIIMYLIFKDRMLMQAYFTTFPLIYSVSKIGCFFGGCCGGLDWTFFVRLT